MTKRDWLAVGIKLIGVYFGVLAFTTIVMLAFRFLFVFLMQQENGPYVTQISNIDVVALLQPIGYLLAAFALIRRTDRFLLFITDKDRGEETE